MPRKSLTLYSKKIAIALLMIMSSVLGSSCAIQVLAEPLSDGAVSTLLKDNKQGEIIFAGQVLFSVAGTNEMPADYRADYINSNLAELLKTIHRNQVQPKLSIRHTSSLSVISVDNRHLLTVTENDVKQNGSSSSRKLAKDWAQILKAAFAKALMENSSAYLWRASAISLSALMIVILLSYTLVRWGSKLRVKRGSSLIIILGLWLLLPGFVLGMFPATRHLRHLLEQDILHPLLIVFGVIWFNAILNRVLLAIIDWRFRDMLPKIWSPTDRRANNMRTIKHVIETTSGWALGTLAVLVCLLLLGVNPASLFTGAGLLGLAVSFVAQDLIKGILNGIAIIIEDQFGVGDVIRIGSVSGVVEAFTLRATKLRNMEGMLIVIPNKDISVVENFTNRFAQVDMQIQVAYDSDLALVKRVMLETATVLSEEWPDKIIERPDMLGVDEFRDSAIVVRLTMKTLPMQQWLVKRELNYRLKLAFDANNIKIPHPQRDIYLYNMDKNSQVINQSTFK